ncbi:hypothetical protein U9M48_026309 [Paspalum notatum var. saurae]|uniref:Squalene cyclase N-terminal domain-containing protein n=1 Tax=Paspalum notatum var. saurae TaxID=547442 RepID=A0AAQ3WY74_PASNO
MWRLKVSEGGGPWLQSANDFLGRQVWEFDADAGTPEERAEVDRLRQEFTRHRYQRKESQDLLLRMQILRDEQPRSRSTCYVDRGNHSLDERTGMSSGQRRRHLRVGQRGEAHVVADLVAIEAMRRYAKLNRLPPLNLPPVKIENSEDVTQDILLSSLRRALHQLSTLQAKDGHWPGEYSGALFIMPMIIFSLYVTGSINTIISSEHRCEILRYICNHQNKDGGWSTNVLGKSSMFGSCLNYAPLRLLGEVPHGESDALSKGRSWILSHGSATALPQWGKLWLSIIGAYDWSGNNPIIPELWMVPYTLPIHPGRFWCFCRLVYMPMAYLYGKKFVGPITRTILKIREELYSIPYENVNWKEARHYCAKEDLLYPRSKVQNIISTCLNKFVEPMLNSWPVNKLREKSLRNLMKHIHYEDETTKYICLSPVNKV